MYKISLKGIFTFMVLIFLCSSAQANNRTTLKKAFLEYATTHNVLCNEAYKSEDYKRIEKIYEIAEKEGKDSCISIDDESNMEEQYTSYFISDINGDGKLEGIVAHLAYSIGGGNFDWQEIKIFTWYDSKWIYKTDVVIESKGRAYVRNVKKDKFYFEVFEYAADDARCCPSIKYEALGVYNKITNTIVIKNYTKDFQHIFISIISKFFHLYENTDTEIRKTKLRFDRKKEIKAFKNNISNWIGYISSIRTTSDGEAIIKIVIHTGKTYNYAGGNHPIYNTSTSIGFTNSPTMKMIFNNINSYINPETELWDKIVNMSEGTQVIFSGQLIEGSKTDHYEENSITEKGSMLNPEYIIKYTDINIRR